MSNVVHMVLHLQQSQSSHDRAAEQSGFSFGLSYHTTGMEVSVVRHCEML
jgi:hypothetical protein